jgi:hypothetical protein
MRPGDQNNKQVSVAQSVHRGRLHADLGKLNPHSQTVPNILDQEVGRIRGPDAQYMLLRGEISSPADGPNRKPP